LPAEAQIDASFHSATSFAAPMNLIFSA